MTNAVDIENVSLVFGGEGNNPVLAVDTIDIAIPKGQFVAIVGPVSYTHLRAHET